MTKTTWMDRLSFLFIIVTMGLFIIWTLQGHFMSNLFQNEGSMTWQFIRSAGITAYILFTLSTLWGLALSSKVVKDWSPGSLSMLLHSSISWLAVVFAALHAGILLFDKYVTYQLYQILVPFTGSYRPVAVGLGTLSFWLMFSVAGSFSIKKRLGHRVWKKLHLTSYGGFFMVTAHAFFAGTDADKIGFELLLGWSMMLVIVLTGYRIGISKTTQKAVRTTKAG